MIKKQEYHQLILLAPYQEEWTMNMMEGITIDTKDRIHNHLIDIMYGHLQHHCHIHHESTNTNIDQEVFLIIELLLSNFKNKIDFNIQIYFLVNVTTLTFNCQFTT